MKNRTVKANNLNNDFTKPEIPEVSKSQKNIIVSPFGPMLGGLPEGYRMPDETIPMKGKTKRDWWEKVDGKTRDLAHFCLPLMMANGAGYYLRSSCHFTCEWDGKSDTNAKINIIDKAPHGVVDDHSTYGGFTIQSAVNIQTENEGDYIWIKQIPNMYRPWFYPMEALIESWWGAGGATAGLVCLLNRPGKFEMKIGDPIAQMILVSKSDLESNLVFNDTPMEESYVWQKRRNRPEYAEGGRTPGHPRHGKSAPDLDYFKGKWSSGVKVPVHLTNWKDNKVIRDGKEQ